MVLLRHAAYLSALLGMIICGTVLLKSESRNGQGRVCQWHYPPTHLFYHNRIEIGLLRQNIAIIYY